MTGPKYTEYHARDWAENKSVEEIRAEIERVEHVLHHHDFKWNEVGNRNDTYVRANILRTILVERGVGGLI